MNAEDQSQLFEQETLERQIMHARTMKLGTVSNKICGGCGDKIPQGRRDALKGVLKCIECAE